MFEQTAPTHTHTHTELKFDIYVAEEISEFIDIHRMYMDCKFHGWSKDLIEA